VRWTAPSPAALSRTLCSRRTARPPRPSPRSTSWSGRTGTSLPGFPAEGIAADVVAGYETPWWAEAKKADADSLAGGPRCSRTRRCSGTRARRTRRGAPRDALRRGAGLRGGEECPRALAAAGADVGHQERAGGGLTPLHVARTLLELGADPEAPDGQGRTPLEQVQQVLEKTPKGNPAAFQLRQGREAARKEPGEGRLQASGHWAEVEKVIDGLGEGKWREYLVPGA
jgi:signal recognition particle 43 kDa protein